MYLGIIDLNTGNLASLISAIEKLNIKFKICRSNFDFENTDKLINYRITNNGDVLTSLPILNYTHVGINLNLGYNELNLYDKSNQYPWYQFSIFNCWNYDKRDTKSYMSSLTKNKW